MTSPPITPDGEISGTTRPREEEVSTSFEPPTKKAKYDDDEALIDGSTAPTPSIEMQTDTAGSTSELPLQAAQNYAAEDLLPPSRSLLPVAKSLERSDAQSSLTFESDVGITEYVSHGVPPIQGIIKQRFTDFLVYEIDQNHNVVHLQSIEKPVPSVSNPTAPAPENAAPITQEFAESIESGDPVAAPVTEVATAPEAQPLVIDHIGDPSPTLLPAGSQTTSGEIAATDDDEKWPARFTSALSPFLSPALIEALKAMYLEGPEPPLVLVSDSGWGSRTVAGLRNEEDHEFKADQPTRIEAPSSSTSAAAPELVPAGRGQGRDRRGGRGGRNTRGGGPNDRREGKPRGKEDPRKVVSDPISEKATRTAFHQAIRTLFEGKLESEVEKSASKSDVGTRIVVKWNPRAAKPGVGKEALRNRRDPRNASDPPPLPPFIHFTMQKANRDTSDALMHLSRLLKCQMKDLGVAGTKDKRGVTVQRVSLRRGGKKLEDVWKAVNGVPGRRSGADAARFRGERGVRIGDLKYARQPLELGHLKGNAFVITLRNVKAEEDTLNAAMQSLKDNGFINYYGMQRFGTSTVPTHAIGLALLKSDWARAISLILRQRPGETEEADEARRLWLEDKNLEAALQMMPRRMVAERCILEAYKKNFSSDKDMQGALHAIPKNLRTMYVHAYQSYVWNAIVSERLSRYGPKPVPGDLVFEKISKVSSNKQEGGGDAEMAPTSDLNDSTADAMDLDETPQAEPEEPLSNDKKKHLTVTVKTLTEADVSQYTIFDVIMPLPGFDVSYPGGELGERYRSFMKLDGLNPDDMRRQRVDYSLSGSYRKIMLLPRHVSWKILRYTDTEVPLAQSDEDKFLGLDPPRPQVDGKFMALQIELQLSSAVYATMALREVTKTETSSHFQSALTQSAEDQVHRGDLKSVGDQTDPQKHRVGTEFV